MKLNRRDLAAGKILRYLDFLGVEGGHVPGFAAVSEPDVYALVSHPRLGPLEQLLYPPLFKLDSHRPIGLATWSGPKRLRAAFQSGR